MPRLYSQPLKILAATLIGIVCAACSQYDVKLNDRVMYTPRPLLTNYTIVDTALAACVKQHINNSRITRSHELTELDCPAMGIRSMQGLQAFHALEHLNLADNRLTEVTELENLTELRNVDLSNNHLRNVSALTSLPKLRYIRLGDNALLLCEGIKFSKAVVVEGLARCVN